ncbi:hypothetical protein HPB48_011568 [Haemaphysalis longicornis]|uniref:Orn/DAP/Arg decarboxylase 2 C-terminal domain-containing protein n=1 Tax=Haemaphysalis longicornis TaxID=44386 RepID=A0A9J6FPY6_HAELO|nr:hypothetical protein HPB48_011568 [Haemaphysalis longicornis]
MLTQEELQIDLLAPNNQDSCRTVRKQHDVYVNESRENSVPRDMYKFLDIAYSPLSSPYERPRNQLTNLWGATCHPLDVIEDGVPFFDVSVGEWLLMDNAGAYGMAEACGFNGFGFPPVHYRTEREDVQRVSGILEASELSPGYSQPEAALRNAPTLMEEPQKKYTVGMFSSPVN